MAACPFAVASRALSWVPVGILTSDLFVSLAISPQDLGGVAIISRLNISLGTHRNFARGDLVSVSTVDGKNRRVCRRITGVSGDEIFQETTGRNIRVPHGHVYLEAPQKANGNSGRHVEAQLDKNKDQIPEANKVCQGVRPISLVNGKVIASLPPLKPYEDEGLLRDKRIYTRI